MPKMTKEERAEVKQHFDALRAFCENKKNKGWEKTYFGDFLTVFENILLPSYSPKSKEFYDEQTELWLNLMAFSEYQASFNFIANHEHLNKWFVDMTKKIRNRE